MTVERGRTGRCDDRTTTSPVHAVGGGRMSLVLSMLAATLARELSVPPTHKDQS
jgi:hypothetical protein